MPDNAYSYTYSYTPQNLVLARKVVVTHNETIQSAVWNMKWPKSGYMKAKCNRGTWVNFPSLPHDTRRCDVCGIYSNFDLNIGYAGVTILIETHGKVIIGDKLIARAQAAQVIAVVEEKSETGLLALDKLLPLYVIERATQKEKDINFTQAYFDVPLLTCTEAQQLIDQQADVWGLSEMIARHTAITKAMADAQHSMIDFEATITTKPNKE